MERVKKPPLLHLLMPVESGKTVALEHTTKKTGDSNIQHKHARKDTTLPVGAGVYRFFCKIINLLYM